MGKGRRDLGNVHEKVYDSWEEEDESGDNCKHDEKRQKSRELAKRCRDKRILMTRNGRGENWRLTSDRFNGNEAPGGVERDDLLWKPHKGNRGVQKRGR
jgi:hypothetical protein